MVLSYAEGALQSEPANKSICTSKPSRKSDKEQEVVVEPMAGAVVDMPKEVFNKCPGKELVVTELPKRLWVSSTPYNSRERVWHEVEGASWDIPIEAWTSVCGWPFSRNSAKVALQSQLSLTQRKCKKCLKKTCG